MRISDWGSDVCSSDLAIYPGYGFLSENERFAEIIEAHDMIFVGPKPEHIRTMGDKVEAKRTAVKLGLPVVPGSPGAVTFSEETKSLAKDIGYPVLIRSEEHTSELQSLMRISYAVFCLKKKNKKLHVPITT